MLCCCGEDCDVWKEQKGVSAQIHYMRTECAPAYREGLGRVSVCLCVFLDNQAWRYPVVSSWRSRPAQRAMSGPDRLQQSARTPPTLGQACAPCAPMRRLRLGEHLTLWLAVVGSDSEDQRRE